MADDFDPVDATASLIAGLLRDKRPVSLPVGFAFARLQVGLGISSDADAATVKTAFERALGAAPSAPNLRERAAAALAGLDGWHVSGEGSGLTLYTTGPETPDEQASRLAWFAGVLRKAGFTVRNEGVFLRVTEAKRAGQDAATAAGTDAR